MQRRREGDRRPPTVITQLTVNDIILGRGSPATGNEGNIRFREIIRSLLPNYTATSRRAEKDRLARLVIEVVRNRQGRFVRRVESPAEADTLDLESLDGVWILVDEEDVIPKVKQTFRDQHSEMNESSHSSSGTRPQSQAAFPQTGLGFPFGTPFTTGMLSPSMPFPFPLAAATASPGFQSNVNTIAVVNQIPLTYNQFVMAPQLPLQSSNNLPALQDLVPRNQQPRKSAERNFENPGNNFTPGLDILAQAAIDRQSESHHDQDDSSSETDSD